jgi:flagellar assembly factor FliW
MPFEHRNGTIAAHDLEEALQSVNIREENLLTLLLVSVHQDSDNIRRLSVNLRAPLFVDAITKQGAQHIFGNSSYAIRHMIS